MTADVLMHVRHVKNPPERKSALPDRRLFFPGGLCCFYLLTVFLHKVCLLMVIRFCFRLAGQMHSQLLEDRFIHGGKHDGGMDLAALQLAQGA